MGAKLGSGREHKFKDITQLRESEVRILQVLRFWDFQNMKSTAFNISLKIKCSVNTVRSGLKYLNSRGLVMESAKGSWFIPESLLKSFEGKKTTHPKPDRASFDQSAQSVVSQGVKLDEIPDPEPDEPQE